MKNYKGNVDSAKNQNIKGKLVEREVYYCASYLVSELAKDDKYMDDLMPVLVSDDWESAAYDEGYKVIENDSLFLWVKEDLKSRDEYDTELEAWEAACRDNDIDPYQTEAYEHWIVSDWFAARLEEHGEMVVRDFLGLTIWGRTTTGQAIKMDYIISVIAAEMGILEGQEYEWQEA